MNRSFHKPLGSLEIDVVDLFGNFAVGSTGACTLDTTNSKGVASVTRNSAGKYTIALSEPIYKFLWANAIVLDTAASDPNSVGVACRIFSQAVNSATAPAFVIQFYNVLDGAAADPASGAAVYFLLKARNSTVG